MTGPPPAIPPRRRAFTLRDLARLFLSPRVLRWVPPLFAACFALMLVLPDSLKSLGPLPGVLVLALAVGHEQRKIDSLRESETAEEARP